MRTRSHGTTNQVDYKKRYARLTLQKRITVQIAIGMTFI